MARLAVLVAPEVTRDGYAPCQTAIHEATTPAGAVPPLPLECGMVRTIVPAMAGAWFTPFGHGLMT